MCVRNYHISTVLFNEEGKNGKSPTKSESKSDNSQKAATTKVTASSEKTKEVGPPAKKKLSTRIIEELKHYYHGFKLLFKEIRMSTRYMIDVVIFRKSLKRREFKQVCMLLYCKFIIQLWTFDEVDIMIYQPRRFDIHRGQWPG